MRSSNLWYVTHSLTTLIKAAVEASPDYGGEVTVSARPPDQLKDSPKTLGFYLYHIAENAHHKNLPPPGSDVPPVRYTPMGLDLFYQLTAHGGDSEAGIQEAHRMMGLAIKALRDYPVIDQSTEVTDTTKTPMVTTSVLDSNLDDSDTRIKIALQPLPHNEAVSFWTAGSSSLQVAAYYQVYVVLLSPEEPKKRVGRVLTYGTYAQVSSPPRLDGNHNVISFTNPNGNENEIELRPAQATPAAAGAIPMESRVFFDGSNIIGDKTILVLKNSLWDEPIEVDDSSWSVRATGSQVTAVIRENVKGKNVKGETVSRKILPGIYAAMVKVTSLSEHELPDGSKRQFDYTSNETPFVVSPRIDSITGPDAQNLVKVKGFIFKHEVVNPQSSKKENMVSLQVYVGNVRLQTGALANLKEGEYAVSEPPPKAPVLQFRLPKLEDLPPPLNVGVENYLPLKVLVNGVESPPRWVKVQ